MTVVGEGLSLQKLGQRGGPFSPFEPPKLFPGGTAGLAPTPAQASAPAELPVQAALGEMG